MSRATVVAILAAAGVILYGPLTSDAIALARAIDSGDASSLVRFAQENPQSQYAPKAIELAVNQNGKGADGNSGKGRGGGGPGNPGKGNNNGKGNAYPG